MDMPLDTIQGIWNMIGFLTLILGIYCLIGLSINWAFNRIDKRFPDLSKKIFHVLAYLIGIPVVVVFYIFVFMWWFPVLKAMWLVLFH